MLKQTDIAAVLFQLKARLSRRYSVNPYRKRFTWLVVYLICLMVITAFVSGFFTNTQVESSKEAITPTLEAFYNVFLGRPLSKKEKAQVIKEFIVYYGGTCSQECEINVEYFAQHTKRMQDYPNQPEDILIRHGIISVNYFEPKNQNTLIMRLLNEPDPVRFADPKSKRLMTERDIIALVNLQAFLDSKSDKLPEEQKLSNKDIEKIVASIDELFGQNKYAGELLLYYVLTAELWASLKRDWQNLSKNERQAVLDYIQYKSQKPLPVYLYQRLFGITSAEAKNFETLERLADLREKMRQTVRVFSKAILQKHILDAIRSATLHP